MAGADANAPRPRSPSMRLCARRPGASTAAPERGERSRLLRRARRSISFASASPRVPCSAVRSPSVARRLSSLAVAAHRSSTFLPSARHSSLSTPRALLRPGGCPPPPVAGPSGLRMHRSCVNPDSAPPGSSARCLQSLCAQARVRRAGALSAAPSPFRSSATLLLRAHSFRRPQIAAGPLLLALHPRPFASLAALSSESLDRSTLERTGSKA